MVRECRLVQSRAAGGGGGGGSAEAHTAIVTITVAIIISIVRAGVAPGIIAVPVEITARAHTSSVGRLLVCAV